MMFKIITVFLVIDKTTWTVQIIISRYLGVILLGEVRSLRWIKNFLINLKIREHVFEPVSVSTAVFEQMLNVKNSVNWNRPRFADKKLIDIDHSAAVTYSR